MKTLAFFIILALIFGSAGFSPLCYAEDCYAAVITEEGPVNSFKLLGTILEPDSENSLAVIEDLNSEKRSAYKIGNEILGFKIVKIMRGEIVLLRDGKKFFLTFPLGSEAQPIVVISEDKRIINRGAIEELVPDLNAALRQAVPLPFIVSGKIKGLKITNIKDKSMALKAGIKEGDVVISVNDLEIDSMKKAAKILREIQSRDKINVVVKRGGDIKNLTYYLN